MKPKSDASSEALYRMLSAHYKTLIAAGCSEDLLSDFASLLKDLRISRSRYSHEAAPTTKHTETAATDPAADPNVIRNMPLEELERLVSNEETPRKLLEAIAINRFSVPKGSMRSFAKRSLLIDKLETLIRNEGAHRTIGTIARSDIQNS